MVLRACSLVVALLAELHAAQGVADGPTDAERAAWTALAERCGSELAWAKDWDEAAARAKAEQKPVLAVAWLYPGFDLVDGARTFFAMDEDVIELVNERCVPLRLAEDTRVPFAAQESYGLSATAFGTALLLVTPSGDVIADSPFLETTAAYDFLCATLAERTEFAGAAAAKKANTTEERAARLLARGELDGAAKLLEKPRTARESFLRARLLRRRHDLTGASAALADARAQEPGELAPEIEYEDAIVALAREDVAAARVSCEDVVHDFPDHARARAAEYVLGLLDLAIGDEAAATRRWSELAAEHPDSRWAPAAAAALLLPESQRGLFSVAPDLELLATLRESPPEPLAPTKASAAAAKALAWLDAERRADGSWPDASELEGGPSAANAISVAIDVLAARALLAHRGDSELDLARESALARAALRASLAAQTGEASYMTYEVWSDALGIELVCDLLARGAGPADELRALGVDLAAALVKRQRTNGGWSYFEAASLAADAQKLEQSISFVTAAVVVALQRAHASGIAVDEKAFERGVDALGALRSDAGVFAYMLWSFQEHAADEPAPGAAGRGPLCELALLGADQSDAESLRGALDLFFTHSATLAKEVGKALMHCGADGQGCHYVLYDYACAARAIAALPEKERKSYRERMLTLVLATRRADGAFLDTPVLGPACGTALALLALAELERP